MARKRIRTAKTISGKTVILRQTTETETGYDCYVLGRNGYAVLVSVPKKVS